MADNTARQPQALENLLQAIADILADPEAAHALVQLQQTQRAAQNVGAVPVNRRAQRRRRHNSNTFFFGIPENYGPTTTYPNAFRFHAGPETYEIVGSGPGGELTKDEQSAAARAMEAIGLPIEELNS
ncbi:hypothetical protein HDV63DRAFT_88918 [Trichoderma sp. SZMC 28014]